MKPDGQISIDPDLLAEFEAATKRPLEQRMKYAFIKTYKPVMDDEDNLPDWLGYGRATE
jgi:hypothetical protein